MGFREPGYEPIMLMHIECPTDHKRAVQWFLKAMYKSNHQKLILLDIKMRFIHDVHDAFGMYGQNKMQKLLDRQFDFSKIA
jgi:hypothetical protein